METVPENSNMELKDLMGIQKITVSDHIKDFQSSNKKSDFSVIDMDSFHHGCNKDSSGKSKFKLQRSISMKGTNTNERTSSPKGHNTQKSEVTMKGTAVDHANNTNIHHITVTTNANISITAGENKCVVRRNSFRRPLNSWFIHPKRVLFFSAALSSMGSIILIYFTLTIDRHNADATSM